MSSCLAWLSRTLPVFTLFALLFPHEFFVRAKTLDGNTGYIYVGTGYGMTYSTGLFCLSKLQPVNSGVQPIELNSAIQGFSGPLNSGQFWFDGSHTGDVILPSFSAD